MMKFLRTAMLAAALALAACAPAPPPKPADMPIGGAMPPPIGAVMFCADPATMNDIHCVSPK